MKWPTWVTALTAAAVQVQVQVQAQAVDPALFNCVTQICCIKNPRQDGSQECWDNCKQYQETLAHSGCNILEPPVYNCIAHLCCAHSTLDSSHECWDNCNQYSEKLAQLNCALVDPATVQPPAPPPPPPSKTSSTFVFSITKVPNPPCTRGCLGWECSDSSPCQPEYSCQDGRCWIKEVAISSSTSGGVVTVTRIKGTATSSTAAAVPTPPSPIQVADNAVSEVKGDLGIVDASGYFDDPTSPTKAKAVKDAISQALTSARSIVESKAPDLGIPVLNAFGGLVKALESALTLATAAEAAQTAVAAAALLEALRWVSVQLQNTEDSVDAVRGVQPAPTAPPGNPTTTTSTSSSSSSTTSACPLCVACADLPELGSGSEGDDDIEGEGDGSFVHGTDTTDILRRQIQARAVKKARSCGVIKMSEAYPAGVTDDMAVYGYKYPEDRVPSATCVWDFMFVSGPSIAPGTLRPSTHGKSYQTEHVYEAQQLTDFATFVDEKARQNLPNHSQTACADPSLVKNFLLWQGSFGTTAWPIANPFSNRGGSAFSAMALALSSESRPWELFGLDKNLNNLKSLLLNLDRTGTVNPQSKSETVEGWLAKVTQMAMLWEYLRQPDVRKAYRDTSNRMRAIMDELDVVYRSYLAPLEGQPPHQYPNWLEWYDEFEERLLIARGDLFQGRMDDMIKEANDSVGQHRSLSDAARLAYQANIARLTGPTGRANPTMWKCLVELLGQERATNTNIRPINPDCLPFV